MIFQYLSEHNFSTLIDFIRYISDIIEIRLNFTSKRFDADRISAIRDLPGVLSWIMPIHSKLIHGTF